MIIRTAILLILALQAYTQENALSNDFQGILCYNKPDKKGLKNLKSEGLNPAIERAAYSVSNWESGQVQNYLHSYSKYSMRDLPNVELSYTYCNIVQNVMNLQKDKIPKKKSISVSNLNQRLFNDNQWLSDNLKSFDEKQYFSFNSTEFLKYNLDFGPKFEDQQDYESSLKANTGYIYGYIASEKPLKTFISETIIIDNKSGREMTLKKYIKQENPNEDKEQLQEIFQNTVNNLKNMIAYLTLSNYQFISQKIDHFEAFEILYYMHPDGRVALRKVKYTDIFESRNNYFPQHRKLYERFTEAAFIMQMQLVQQKQLLSKFEPGDAIYQAIQDEILETPQGLTKIIDQQQNFNQLDQYIQNQENKETVLEQIYGVYDNLNICFSNIQENKNQPFYRWYNATRPDKWNLIPKNSLWRSNIQNCDIIMTHVRNFDGKFNHNLERNLWNYTPQVAHMHNKDQFYRYISKYDSKNSVINPDRTFNSTFFLPETYVLSFKDKELTKSEKQFFELQNNDSKMYIFKPNNMSRARGIQLVTDIEKFQQQMRDLKFYGYTTIYSSDDEYSQSEWDVSEDQDDDDGFVDDVFFDKEYDENQVKESDDNIDENLVQKVQDENDNFKEQQQNIDQQHQEEDQVQNDNNEDNLLENSCENNVLTSTCESDFEQQGQKGQQEKIMNQTQERESKIKIKKDSQGVLQSYINNPLTTEGRKFDYRGYLVIASTKPGEELVFYHEGYIRISAQQYEPLSVQTPDARKGAHVTNGFQQIIIDGHETYTDLQGLWSDMLVKLKTEGKTDEEIEKLKQRIKSCLTYIAEAYLSISKKQPGFFQYFGMDIMVTEDLQPIILEGNSSPGILFPQREELTEQNRKFVESVMNLETFLQEHRDGNYQELPLGGLELLIDNKKGFNYIDEHKVYEN